MQFDSLAFIGFFIVIITLNKLVVVWSARKIMLLAASYFFYASWNPFFLPLLIVSSALAWWMSLKMSRSIAMQRKIWLWAILFANLSVLFVFKYLLFFTEVLHGLFFFMDREAQYSESIILPLGISFYTFHSLSYCIDVYRNKFPATKNLRDYLLYVAFFPQLVAGPIVRWTQMREQIESPRSASAQDIALGIALLIFGLFEKVVLADSVFAPVANEVFSQADWSAAQAWSGVIAFSGQIFCDFAGYSTCAIGAALALGFKLPVNFKNPYAARGLSDFWKRWHISLSTWLRDYLYISLGGNRSGFYKTLRNLFLTMLIGGLWHGAAWTFVVWGALHGAYLVIEHTLRHLTEGFNKRAVDFFSWLCTLLCVMYAWVWFRAESLQQAIDLTKRLFFIVDSADKYFVNYSSALAVLVFVLVVMVQLIMRDKCLKELFCSMPAWLMGLMMGAMLAAVVLSPGLGVAFIYFQF